MPAYMKNFYRAYRKLLHVRGCFLIENLLLHHFKIHKLDITADSPLMNKHTIPIPLQGTSKLLPLGKWGVVSSALLLALGENPVPHQTVTAPPGQTPAATQQATPDVASELDAMKKRIEQLESELSQQKKDKENNKDT